MAIGLPRSIAYGATMMPLSILLVDDDEPIRAAISRALRGAGHVIEMAGDGRQGLRAVATAPPDLVITDLMMPNSDGMELITALKERHPAVRILAISGHATFGAVDLLQVAAMLGADATLAKPFSPEELLAGVAEAMAHERGPT